MARVPRQLKRTCTALALCFALLSGHALGAATPGSFDPAFGKGGVVGIEAGAVATARWPDLAIDGGRPVVLTESRDGGSALFFLRRDGLRDASVGDAGVVRIETAATGGGSAVQPDGRIVLAGSVGQVPAVMRLDVGNPGEPDPTFSGDGILEVPLESASSGLPHADEAR